MPAPARAKKATAQTTLVSLEERVRQRAYQFYVERGNKSGSELEDWLQAEDEIRRAEEEAIDKAFEESFPASDPPAY